MSRYKEKKVYRPEVLEKLHAVQLQILEDFIGVCDKYDLVYFAVYGTAIGAVRHQGFIPWDDDIDIGMLREDYDKFLQVFHKELGEQYYLLTPEIDGRYACTVTHIQKKGTRFISEVTQGMEYEQGIFMDIFPFDYVAEEKREQLKQGRRANILGKLLFLSGNAYPVIPYEGIKRKIGGLMCIIIYRFLNMAQINPKWLYKKYVSNATAYNEKKGRYVTSFEYMGCLKDKVRVEALFPVKKVKFEHLMINLPANNHEFLEKVYGNYMQLPPEKDRVNHMPLIIQFEGEESIYE